MKRFLIIFCAFLFSTALNASQSSSIGKASDNEIKGQGSSIGLDEEKSLQQDKIKDKNIQTSVEKTKKVKKRLIVNSNSNMNDQ